MSLIDVFNGDADGICALHQLRLAEPADSQLVTGPKRDISLLKRVNSQAGDRITVLDIALSKNRDALDRLLAAGAQVRYFDHHQPGDIPVHPNFEAHIDTDANVCTSLLVNEYLQGRQLAWAVTAAFGDRLLRPFADPFAFIAESTAYQTLKTGYQEDMARAVSVAATESRDAGRIFMLPAEKWARRISGVFGNQLAVEAPTQAHAVLTAKREGGYVVSVRAPLVAKFGADELCSQFETGGGRKGAAGINQLPDADLGRFIATFFAVFTRS